MTETELRKKVVKALKKYNAVVIPYVGSTMGQAGTADVFIAHSFWNGWIEFKGPSTKIKPIQMHFRNQMRERNVNAYIVRLHNHGIMSFEEETWPDGTHYSAGQWIGWRTGLDFIQNLKQGPYV